MGFNVIIQQIKNKKVAGVKYEQEGRHRFRDFLTVCVNEKVVFERYCYGEAASKVCTLIGKVENDNEITWDFDNCSYGSKEDAPKKISKVDAELLFFDDKSVGWKAKKELKTVPEAGLGRLKMLFIK